MKNLLLRLLIMIIFLPTLWIILFVIPAYNHLLFNLATIIVTLLAAYEVENFFHKKRISTWRFAAPLLGVILPIYTFLEISGVIPRGYFTAAIVLLMLTVFIRGIFTSSRAALDGRLEFFSSSLMIVMYPGLLLSFIVRLTDTSVFGPMPQFAILVFLSLVFLNDIMAYVGGMLLGRYSRLNLIVSPKKSLVGFITGFVTSIGVAIFYSLVLSDHFILRIPAAVLLGSVIGLFTIAGDLLESVMKRACEIKDSGTLMAGRGGLMDTIDSLLLSAPVFYFLFPLLVG
jgi:phosphatidate cytidylyltransferase